MQGKLCCGSFFISIIYRVVSVIQAKDMNLMGNKAMRCTPFLMVG